MPTQDDVNAHVSFRKLDVILVAHVRQRYYHLHPRRFEVCVYDTLRTVGCRFEGNGIRLECLETLEPGLFCETHDTNFPAGVVDDDVGFEVV